MGAKRYHNGDDINRLLDTVRNQQNGIIKPRQVNIVGVFIKQAIWISLCQIDRSMLNSNHVGTFTTK